jgi:hypothetical protein
MNDPISPPETHDRITHALEAQSLELEAFLKAIPSSQFFEGSNESWSPAHHTRHVIQAIDLLTYGLTTPERQRPAPEGTCSKTYTEIRDAYRTALGDGVQVGGPFVPLLQTRSDHATYQSEIIAGLQHAIRQFSGALSGWPEERLDSFTLKHPLLGPLTIREMALFTLYHNEHHRAGIEKRL